MENEEASKQRRDYIIRQTDDDANGSRLSAVKAGVLHDPFAGYFGDLTNAPRRMPIINHGTSIRTRSLNILIEAFIHSCRQEGSKAQVISLGAGSDTRPFVLIQRGFSDVLYREIDVSENVEGKLAAINRHPELRGMLSGDEKIQITAGQEFNTVCSGSYHLQGLDLRSLGEKSEADDDGYKSAMTSIAADVPTLILSECCLCYLQPDTVDEVLTHLLGPGGLLSPSTRAGLVFYEPIRPMDSFGATMVRNLQMRGIEMPTLSAFPSLDSQRARFSRYGLHDGAKAIDIHRASERWFSESEQEILSRQNPLDEVEEWHMLAQHYCISWGWRGSSGWSSWQDLPE